MISVCIASRGRPELLRECVTKLVEGMTLQDTVISVALDKDDERLADYQQALEHAKFSVADREDSLGAKYNRAQRQCPADLYILWADDMVMPDKGWDLALETKAQLFGKRGVGVIYFGNIPNVFQPGVAVTHKFAEYMKGICPEHFPFWWGETWGDECARFCDRIIYSDVNVSLLTETRGSSQGVREITFWAKIFDDLRPTRIEIAKKIIAESSDPPWRKEQLLQRIPALAQILNQRNSKLRDPAQAVQLEAYYRQSNDPPDERYLRLKAKAREIIGQ